MAKVKIQGHASGTGVLTVTAPNTSTDRTITLPDATGTLLNSDGDGSSLTGVADATKLPLAGGNLTGAVSLVGGDLIIDQTNNGYSGLRIHDDSGGDYNSYIDLGRNQGGTRLSIRKGGRTQGTSPWQNATPDVIVSFANEGIAFHGDTAAANTLDDYEEGTWTPSLQSVVGSISMGSSTATYTKVGRLVTCQAFVVVSSVSSPSGRLTIQGLPFTKNTSLGESVTTVYANSVNSYTGNLILRIPYLDIQTTNGADPGTGGGSVIKANSELSLTFSYFT